MEHIGVRDLREQLGKKVDEVFFRGQPIVIERSGEPRAALVPYEWLASKAGEEDKPQGEA
ncbi:type II toxin-antitoxin system Phd/YefM family antitoxin [Streptomyces sp. ND04-05B]|uniref:type II toxin-antitoxin system Phd/YefM family antitoxin n=1 Tax=Streptomyces sp. ND04-05B TaxID=3028693 RepID=UPI0029B07C13|nr:type II toxin-antitoxin system Phd/YefM family antitoxin [Streptomyces sp. ND04-05B]MDX3067153.1 type II toxin-antitoxin system Phd/YefM family antitoxin [Streptomyces sp. ND04-05B]